MLMEKRKPKCTFSMILDTRLDSSQKRQNEQKIKEKVTKRTLYLDKLEKQRSQ